MYITSIASCDAKNRYTLKFTLAPLCSREKHEYKICIFSVLLISQFYINYENSIHHRVFAHFIYSCNDLQKSFISSYVKMFWKSFLCNLRVNRNDFNNIFSWWFISDSGSNQGLTRITKYRVDQDVWAKCGTGGQFFGR